MKTDNEKQNEELKIHEDWDTRSKELKSEYPELTDEDLKYEKGKEDELLNRVEKRLGKDRDTIMGLMNRDQNGQQHNKEEPNKRARNS